MNIKQKKYFLLLAVLLTVCVAALGIMQLVHKDQTFSEMENRNLETKPSLSVRSVSSGRYMSQYESYVEDQFPLRNHWLQLKTTVERLMGKTESNGVFLGKRGYLIQDFTPPDEAQYLQTAETIRSFQNQYPELKQYALIVPTAVSSLSEYLPAPDIAGDENAFLDRVAEMFTACGIKFIDVRDTFSTAVLNGEQMYYKTDHHWTTGAAYTAYQSFAEQAGLAGTDTEYEPLLISDSFSGTLTASSGFRTSETDELYLYQPKKEDDVYHITYVDEGTVADSFYCTDALSERDQYEVFLGGNHPLVNIETYAESDRVLLMFKDSYANCFVPFMVGDYKKIVMVDPRYYADTVDKLIETENVTDILYLYNANSFASDTSLKTVIQ